MTYLFIECNESRLCVFRRETAKLWSRVGPAAKILVLTRIHTHTYTHTQTHTHYQTEKTNEKQMVSLYGIGLFSTSLGVTMG